MATLSAALEQGFEDAYTGSEVTIEAKTTDQAIRDVLNANADFAAISRPLTDAETAQGLEAIALQRPKIAVVVDQSNPFAQSLTGTQFAQIFRGEISDWAEIGGTARPIKLVDRPANNEVRQSLQPYPVFTAAPFEPAASAITLQPDTTEALATALGPDGIGYVLVSELASQPSLKALQLHRTPPTDSRYPFSQPYALVYARGAASPAVAAFLGYATGQPGQAIIARTDFSDTSRSSVAASPDSTSTAAGNADTTDADGNASSTTPNADGRLFDAEDRLINSAGFLINQDGDLVDENGTLLAAGAEGVLGTGVDPDALNADAIESDDTEGNINERLDDISDQDSERGRWWWLLLPLAGLALLIWAAGKSSKEEETDYTAGTADTDAGNGPESDERIISAFDSDTGETPTSEAATVGAVNASDTGISAATLGLASVSAASTDTTDIEHSSAAIAPDPTIDGTSENVVDDTDEPKTTARPYIVGVEDSVGVANSDDEDWLQRAKQRINAATEQMKQTAAEIKDDAVEKR
jgi:ABC-type phosphate transport system substrate-binding protein